MNETASIAVLLPIRLFVGWVFLRASLVKLSAGWIDHPRVTPIVEGWLREGRTYGFFAPFLRDTVIPNAQLFSRLVSVGELCVGASLLAGLFTRLGAFVGFAMALCYMLARGDGAEANATAPFVAMSLALLFSHSGRALGLDAALAGRMPRWLT